MNSHAPEGGKVKPTRSQLAQLEICKSKGHDIPSFFIGPTQCSRCGAKGFELYIEEFPNPVWPSSNPQDGAR